MSLPRFPNAVADRLQYKRQALLKGWHPMKREKETVEGKKESNYLEKPSRASLNLP